MPGLKEFFLTEQNMWCSCFQTSDCRQLKVVISEEEDKVISTIAPGFFPEAIYGP